MNRNPSRTIRFPALTALMLALLLSAACSPAASGETAPETSATAGVETSALTQVTPAAEPTTAALATAPTAVPSAAAETAAESTATAELDAYPEPVAGSQPLEAYPLPAIAESLEGYPGATIVDAPEGLDLDPATLGRSLPALLEQFTGDSMTDVGVMADDPLLTLILADAAGRAGTEPEALSLVRIESVTWPDTSLGCPDSERGYAQVQIEGYILTLAAGTSTYTYHTDGGLQTVLCEDGTPLAVDSASQQ